MTIKQSTRSGRNVLEYQSETLDSQKDQAALSSNDPSKISVELYLRAKDVKIWHRGGKIAFAEAKGLMFGTEAEFDDLFKAY